MRASVITIGDEVLDGFTVNSNAALIGQKLTEKGLEIACHLVVPDSEAALFEALQLAAEKSEVIIITGGLGPTCDDTTREAIAAYFGAPLYVDEKVKKHLEERYGKEFPTIENQATVPKGAILLPNQLGTASGLLFERKGKRYFFLPGVPQEMEAILKGQVVDLLEPGEERQHLWRQYVGLIEADIDPTLREIKRVHPSVKIGIYPRRGVVAVHLSGLGVEEAAKPLDRAFKKACFATSPCTIEEALHHLFTKKKLTLSAAESCTGGALSARMTALPGASLYFLGSLVSYSNQVKEELLGVSPETLKRFGAVSCETAEEMVEGAIARFRSDYSIAITGIAGPSGGSEEKPVGTVWISVKKRGAPPRTMLLKARGSREMVITYAVNRALGELFFLVV